MPDAFARIALQAAHRSVPGLVTPEPPPRPTRVLAAVPADRPAFEPPPKLAEADDLQRLLAEYRERYRPFLADLAPPLPSCRTRQRLTHADWRLETEQDRRNFPSSGCSGHRRNALESSIGVPAGR